MREVVFGGRNSSVIFFNPSSEDVFPNYQQLIKSKSFNHDKNIAAIIYAFLFAK